MSDFSIYSDGAATVLLAGVGGQGTILAADLLAKTAIANGFDVKLSEVHGMSQRGGSVTTTVRIGSEVHSMVCEPGSADYILAFEAVEGLRALPYLKAGGMLLVNDEEIRPLPVLTGAAEMPRRTCDRLRVSGGKIIPAYELAKQAGSPKCANVVLLGALSAGMPFPQESWEEQIRLRVPAKTIEMNIEAFRLGREA